MGAFETNLAWGEEGEHLIARWLLRRGVAVAPLYRCAVRERGPVLLHEADGHELARVLPDLTCWRRQRCFFAEVKRKKRWVGPFTHRKKRGAETGFNLNHWRDYRLISGTTGAAVWVFFLHEEKGPTGVWAGEVTRLETHLREWDGCSEWTGKYIEKPLALFPRHVLKRVADLSEVLP